MRYKTFLGALVAAASLASITPALARNGCGAGWHRGYNGYCYRDRAPVRIVVAPARPVVGVYYHRHGWWDGRRYWAKRYYHRSGWRYR